jgi:hypothetical protein
MARLTKNNPRFSNSDFFDSEMAAEKGEMFKTPSGDWDSSSVTVLHNGIDTIKQLYSGLIDNEVLLRVVDFYENNEANSKTPFILNGLPWKLTSGRRGGYRYLLKNEELGVIVLFGSFYCAPNLNGHHLKIELSPHFILSRDVDTIQEDMDDIATWFITQVVYTGVALHLCADVQGWEIPNDLEHKMTCKARRCFNGSGISFFEFDGLDLMIKYGRGQSYTWGSISSLQFSVYNKSKQAKDIGSLPFWSHVWNRDRAFVVSTSTDDENFHSSDKLYDPDKSVSRLEVRFHHSVIDQFARGMSMDFRSFKSLKEHFTGLWNYGLNHFRLDATPTYIDPFWQFMRDDLQFCHDSQAFDYIRSYDKKLIPSAIPSERSVKIWLGLSCSMFRKAKYSLKQAMEYLQSSGVFHWLEYYFQPPVYDYEEDEQQTVWDAWCAIESVVEEKLAYA